MYFFFLPWSFDKREAQRELFQSLTFIWIKLSSINCLWKLLSIYFCALSMEKKTRLRLWKEEGKHSSLCNFIWMWCAPWIYSKVFVDLKVFEFFWQRHIVYINCYLPVSNQLISRHKKIINAVLDVLSRLLCDQIHKVYLIQKSWWKKSSTFPIPNSVP